MNREIRVFAPATVSNIACGFDIMGFAIDCPGDEVVLRVTDNKGVVISGITGDDGRLTKDPSKNTAGAPLISMIEKLNLNTGLELEIHKKMPFGSGLGSSAASAVAAAFALNHLLELNLSKEQLLPFAIDGEIIASGSVHADNVAPALYGGFTLIRGYDPIDVIKLGYPKDLFCTVIHPHIEISTKVSRDMLPTSIPLRQAVKQWGNCSGLTAGLLTDDYSLIGRSLVDSIVEPVRSRLIPCFDNMKSAAVAAGALGCSISGSGPSLFALSRGEECANKVGIEMKKAFNSTGIGSDIYVSTINEIGPKILYIK